MVVALFTPHVGKVLYPLPPSGIRGIFQHPQPAGGFQQVTQPAQPPYMGGFHKAFLTCEVRHQQFVHQVHQVGAGIFARQSLLLLEAVDERSENPHLIHRIFVDEVKEITCGFQAFFRRRNPSGGCIILIILYSIYIIYIPLR